MHRDLETGIVCSSADSQCPSIEKFSSADEQDFETILDAMKCPHRRQVLLLLSSGRRANVMTICQWMNLPQPTVSHHLGLLRTAGLVSHQRAGKTVFYECPPDLVRTERTADHFILKIGRANGVCVTLTVATSAASRSEYSAVA